MPSGVYPHLVKTGGGAKPTCTCWKCKKCRHRINSLKYYYKSRGLEVPEHLKARFGPSDEELDKKALAWLEAHK